METTRPERTSAKVDLTAVLTEVLGDLAFMVNDDDAAHVPPGAVWLECEIAYRGPASGRLCCWCTRDFAIQLAANLLGTEPDEGDAQVGAEDAVCEFMNVLCGQLVTAWHGETDVFTLSIPTLRECIETPAPPTERDASYCQISVGGEPLHCVHRPLEGQ